MMPVKTLLVDDERSLLEQAKIFLERASEKIDVTPISSVDKALELMDEEDFDVIVSDYQMPDMDGLDLLEEIREEKDNEIPFIMFTGKGREEVAMKALNLGANRYIKKEGNPKDQFEFLADAVIRETKQFETKKEKEEREKKIRKLYEASIELSDYNSEEEIYRHVLNSFKSILDFQASSICMEGDGDLIVKATDAENVGVGEKRSNDEGIRGLTIQNQRSYLIDDLSEWEEAKPSDTEFKSVLSIPINDEGVYQALSYEKNYFDEFDLKMAEMLISHMLQVIDGIRYRDELEENRIWLSQIVENSSIPTFVIDEDHKVTHWNKACENLTGIPKNEVVGTKEIWKAFYDEERPVMADLVLENAPEKEIEKYYGDKFKESFVLSDAYEAEDLFSEFKDEGRWVYFTAAPIKDAEGNRIGAIETLQDITDRKISEQKLKEKEEKYRTIFESANDAIFILKEDRFFDCNEKTLEIFESDREEIIGKSPYEFSPEKQPDGRDSRGKAIEKINSALEGKPQEFEWVHTTKDGEPFYTEVALNQYEIDGEKFVIAIVRDITDRKKAEDRIKENKDKIERLHEISADLQTYDSDNEIYSLAVEAAEDILDFDICSFDDVEGDRFVTKKVSSTTPEDGFANRRIEEGGLDRKTYLNQESYLVGDLSEDEDAKPVKDEYQSAISIPIGEHGVFQAVSIEVDHFAEEDLKTAELLISHVSQALERIQAKEKEEFLHSLLRHDVGNKNQIIKGYLELMRDHDLPDEVKDFVNKAERAAKKSTDIIEKVRKLREIEEEKEISEIDVNSMIDKMFSEHQAQLQEKGINFDIDECSGKVKGGALLEELFSNLIENSIQHSECDEIRITSQVEDDECIVTVEDDGVGISDEMKDKIFERGFKKGENSGTGLGLYMVKEIADSYGGSVEVKDSNLGGARFDVRLKRA